MAMTLIALACGCCAPHSLPLYSGESADITVDGTRFLVRYTNSRAEATRVSPELSPNRMVILSRALRAIESASGCSVRPGTLYGDWNLIEAYLSCPDEPSGTMKPVLVHQPPVSELR